MKRAFLIFSFLYLLLCVFLGGYPLNTVLIDPLFNAKFAIILFAVAIAWAHGAIPRIGADEVREGAVLAVILIVATFLRFAWLKELSGYGPPVDEPLLVDPVLKMLRTGNLDFHVYEYGGVMFYLLLGAFIVFVCGAVSSFQFRTFKDIPENMFYLAGRYFVSGISVFTIAVAYFVARRFFGKLAAVVAAVILALSWLCYTTAHEVRLDLALALFILAANYFFLRMLDEPSALNYCFAGLFSGLSVGTKYTVVPIFASLLLAHFFSNKEKRLLNWNVVLAFATGFGVYILFNYYALIHLDEFIFRLPQAIYHNLNPEHWSASGNRALVYFKLLGTIGVGAVALIPALLTLCLAARNADRKLLMLWSFPIFFLALVGKYPSGFPRYLMPLLPNIAILAGAGTQTIVDWIRARGPSVSPALAGTCAVLLIGVVPAWQATQYTLEMRHVIRPQSIVDWVNQNVPEESVIIVDPTGPILPSDRYQIETLDYGQFLNARNFRDADYLCVTEDLFRSIPASFEVAKEFPAQTKSLDRYIRIYQHKTRANIEPPGSQTKDN